MSYLSDLPESDRPNDEVFVSLSDACERWPSAFAEALKRLGTAPTRASTALSPRFNGTPHLFLWGQPPAHLHLPNDMEVCGVSPLPPEIAQIREMIREVSA